MGEEQTDLERVGLFIDGPYDTEPTEFRVTNFATLMGRDSDEIDDPLRLDGPFPIIPGHKTKAATNDWTFDEEFKSLWEDVPYDDPGAWRKEYELEQNELILEGPFNSAIASKTMNGSGTLYGTFMEGKEYEAMSPEEKDKPDNDLEGVPNFLTNPGKKGTGYGYVDVCLNPYPEYMEDPMFDQLEAKREMRETYEAGLLERGEWIPAGPPQEYFDKNPFFDPLDPEGQTETYDFSRLEPKETFEDKEPFLPSNPTKKINGNKDVVAPLERFPEYIDGDLYIDPPPNIFRQTKVDPEKPVWKPQFGNRSRQTKSILSKNITFRINSSNFHMF